MCHGWYHRECLVEAKKNIFFREETSSKSVEFTCHRCSKQMKANGEKAEEKNPFDDDFYHIKLLFQVLITNVRN